MKQPGGDRIMGIFIRMTKYDLELLATLGIPVTDYAAELNTVKDEKENGFHTVSFLAGSTELAVYLDIRYEAGGPYQFTADSKEKLRHLDSTGPLIKTWAIMDMPWYAWY